MACRYYDDILVAKLKRWVPEESHLRVLKPDETKRLFELNAEDNKDEPIKLPVIALSRDPDIELLLNVKNPRSFDGLNLTAKQYNKDTGRWEPISDLQSIHLNVIPIKLGYKLRIFTKKADEGDEYVRQFLFKLINNPLLKITIPYNDVKTDEGRTIEHTANIRVLSTVSDTSDITERIFPGQFTVWTIELEIQDAFLFSIPYRNNWHLIVGEELGGPETNDGGGLEVSNKITEPGEIEEINE